VARLDGLSPTAKLKGGFGYISGKNQPILSASAVSVGDTIDITLHDGQIITKVTDTVISEQHKYKQI
jgi:exodeoxyribonuclease VII large subunit